MRCWCWRRAPRTCCVRGRCVVGEGGVACVDAVSTGCWSWERAPRTCCVRGRCVGAGCVHQGHGFRLEVFVKDVLRAWTRCWC
uniref:Uncharacterized protein n=1 Tax=Phytophthora fragariae TaxID=53985 RepID=A0A6A3DFG0_9STRA|nr:hypothetical protein PF009_g30604 [Phytophthora fragariae]